MLHHLFRRTIAIPAAVHLPTLRELTTGLCLLAFLLGFVLWFITYVRVERPGSDGSGPGAGA
jgi:hypothetical protein